MKGAKKCFQLKKVPKLFVNQNSLGTTYPEIGDSSFRCALWTFKQQLTLKVRVRCDIYIVLL